MKPITFNKNSWHYRLVTYLHGAPDRYDYYGEPIHVDRCSYAKTLFGCLLLVAVCTAVVFFMGVVPWVNFAVWVYVGLTNHWTPLDFTGVGALSEVAIGALFGLCYLAVTSYDKSKAWRKARKQLNGEPDEPSIVREIYRMFKDKTCMQIEFK